MDKIEKFVADFFQNHSTLESFNCMKQLQNMFGLNSQEAYAVISKHLSAAWGIYTGV